MIPRALQRERLDRLERTITLLTKSQNSTGSDLSVLTNQTKQALYNLLDKMNTAQYSGIYRRRGYLPAGAEPSAGQHRPDGGLCRYHRGFAG